MKSAGVKNKDIRFNNGVKTQAVRMRAAGEFEHGYWMDGKFVLEGVAPDIEAAMLAVDMHRKASNDNRPPWRK